MEPILEISTRITTLLWHIHALNPESRLGRVLESDWKGRLTDGALRDYSRFQGLLDLAGMETDWNRNDPLTRPKIPWSKIIPHYWARWRNRRVPQPGYRDLRQAAIEQAIEAISRRTRALQEGLLVKAIDEAAPDAEARTNETIPGLTREQLFDLVATWAFGPGRAALRPVTEAFFGSGDDRKALFMEQDLDRVARSIPRGVRAPAKERRAVAREWIRNTKDQKLDTLLDRPALLLRSTRLGAPVPFSMVQSDELDEIARSRLVRLHGSEPGAQPAAQVRANTGVSAMPGTPARQAFDSCLFGMALSGGGIRAATFSLGLLQGMADRNILPWIDVISTVSGGGYIGSWLIAWIKRRGSVASVQESMRGFASSFPSSFPSGPDRPVRGPVDAPPNYAEPFRFFTANADPRSDHVRPIRVLRDYARFLAPRSGFFSPDNWTIATVWLRNASLNLAILLLMLGAILLAPRILIWAWGFRMNWISAHPRKAIAEAGAPLIAACFLIAWRNLSTFGRYRRPAGRTGRGDDDQTISKGILPLIIAGASLESFVLWMLAVNHVPAAWPVGLIAAVLAVSFVILCFPSWLSQKWDDNGSPSFMLRVAAPVSVLTGSGLIWWLYSLHSITELNPKWSVWVVGSFGLAAMVFVTACVFTVFIGMCGRDLSDEQREWWSRLAAWIGIATFGWLAVCSIAFFAPLGLAKLWSMTVGAVAAAGWTAITGAGLKWAFSPSSGRNGGATNQSWVQKAVLRIAPVVFVVGMLSVMASGLVWAVAMFPDDWRFWSGDSILNRVCGGDAAVCLPNFAPRYWELMAPESPAPVMLFLVFVALCLFLARRVDVNEFSMHNFYKNRLVRAYLGASRDRAHRYPNNFTGFDLEDDIRLRRFQCSDPSQPRDMPMDNKASYGGPFPVINTALNITKGADLGVQQRKAESFVFTPLWSGFDFSRRQAAVASTNLSEYGFQRTDRFGEPGSGGAMLGTAMAISGAAFNANAGFHTSPALAFLLTVFGVRLGWWAGNPRGRKWTLPSPRLGLFYLRNELIANTSTEKEFVLLSDGGHFENMGLYELIRRRCRYIIVSDAEEDEKFKLEGIGGAIRKCRVDFGVTIDLNLDALQPLGDPAVSHFHYSLGTITYPGEAICGKLIYIKASVTGDEPVDVVEFRKRHNEFPHTSTADQFFDESHFESYRALGHHTAREVFTSDLPKLPLPPQDPSGACRLAMMFAGIEQNWNDRMQWLQEQKKAPAGLSVVSQ